MRMLAGPHIGAAEQLSRWWNKMPNLCERQRVFGVQLFGGLHKKAGRVGIVRGVLARAWKTINYDVA